MRSIFAPLRLVCSCAVVLQLYATGARGSCLLGETEESFVGALYERLKATGVRDIDYIGHGKTPTVKHYIMLGSDISLFLDSQEGILEEIGFVLSTPSGPADADRELTAAAFVLSRFSGNSEPTIKDQLNASLKAHGNESWLVRSGGAAAVFTRSPEGVVIKLGKPGC